VRGTGKVVFPDAPFQRPDTGTPPEADSEPPEDNPRLQEKERPIPQTGFKSAYILSALTPLWFFFTAACLLASIILLRNLKAEDR